MFDFGGGIRYWLDHEISYLEILVAAGKLKPPFLHLTDACLASEVSRKTDAMLGGGTSRHSAFPDL